MDHSLIQGRHTARPIIVLLTLVALVGSLFISVSVVSADGQGSSAECETDINVDSQDVGQSQNLVTFTAEGDDVITGICIKTGSSEGHLPLVTADGTVADCYEIDGIGTHTVTVTRNGDGPDCQGISHVDVVTGEGSPSTSQSEEADIASLNIKKVDGNNRRLPGAVFTVEGMEGTFTTGEDGTFCLTGFPADAEILVTEIQAPPGYQIANPASQLVEVDDDGDCDSPDAVFVNTLAEQSVSASASASVEQSVSASASQSVEQSVEGGTGTPEQSVQGGTGSPEASMGNGSVSSQGTSSVIPAIAFGIIALLSLGGLAAVNLATVRRRT